MKEPGQIAWDAACKHYGINAAANSMTVEKQEEFAAIERAVLEEAAKVAESRISIERDSCTITR